MEPVPDPQAKATQERLEAAVEALSDPARFREAEALVATVAPGLQRILTQALDAGGWFAESHDSEVTRVAQIEDTAERHAALRVLLAEETRMGMMVGVAVGWAISEELARGEATTEPPAGEEEG
jgi:hypothetical protein